MPDYQKMYSILFNEITNIIEQLQTVQIKTEELYINLTKPPIKLIAGTETVDHEQNVSPADALIDNKKTT